MALRTAVPEKNPQAGVGAQVVNIVSVSIDSQGAFYTVQVPDGRSDPTAPAPIDRMYSAVRAAVKDRIESCFDHKVSCKIGVLSDLVFGTLVVGPNWLPPP